METAEELLQKYKISPAVEPTTAEQFFESKGIPKPSGSQMLWRTGVRPFLEAPWLGKDGGLAQSYAGAVSGLTAHNIVPGVTAPDTTGERVLRQAGDMVGMGATAVGLAATLKTPNPLVLGAAYGAMQDTGEPLLSKADLAERGMNSATTAAMFGVLHKIGLWAANNPVTNKITTSMLGKLAENPGIRQVVNHSISNIVTGAGLGAAMPEPGLSRAESAFVGAASFPVGGAVAESFGRGGAKNLRANVEAQTKAFMDSPAFKYLNEKGYKGDVKASFEQYQKRPGGGVFEAVSPMQYEQGLAAPHLAEMAKAHNFIIQNRPSATPPPPNELASLMPSPAKPWTKVEPAPVETPAPATPKEAGPTVQQRGKNETWMKTTKVKGFGSVEEWLSSFKNPEVEAAMREQLMSAKSDPERVRMQNVLMALTEVKHPELQNDAILPALIRQAMVDKVYADEPGKSFDTTMSADVKTFVDGVMSVPVKDEVVSRKVKRTALDALNVPRKDIVKQVASKTEAEAKAKVEADAKAMGITPRADVAKTKELVQAKVAWDKAHSGLALGESPAVIMAMLESDPHPDKRVHSAKMMDLLARTARGLGIRNPSKHDLAEIRSWYKQQLKSTPKAELDKTTELLAEGIQRKETNQQKLAAADDISKTLRKKKAPKKAQVKAAEEQLVKDLGGKVEKPTAEEPVVSVPENRTFDQVVYKNEEMIPAESAQSVIDQADVESQVWQKIRQHQAEGTIGSGLMDQKGLLYMVVTDDMANRRGQVDQIQGPSDSGQKPVSIPAYTSQQMALAEARTNPRSTGAIIMVRPETLTQHLTSGKISVIEGGEGRAQLQVVMTGRVANGLPIEAAYIHEGVRGDSAGLLVERLLNEGKPVNIVDQASEGIEDSTMPEATIQLLKNMTRLGHIMAEAAGDNRANIDVRVQYGLQLYEMSKDAALHRLTVGEAIDTVVFGDIEKVQQIDPKLSGLQQDASRAWMYPIVKQELTGFAKNYTGEGRAGIVDMFVKRGLFEDGVSVNTPLKDAIRKRSMTNDQLARAGVAGVFFKSESTGGRQSFDVMKAAFEKGGPKNVEPEEFLHHLRNFLAKSVGKERYPLRDEVKNNPRLKEIIPLLEASNVLGGVEAEFFRKAIVKAHIATKFKIEMKELVELQKAVDESVALVNDKTAVPESVFQPIAKAYAQLVTSKQPSIQPIDIQMDTFKGYLNGKMREFKWREVIDGKANYPFFEFARKGTVEAFDADGRLIATTRGGQSQSTMRRAMPGTELGKEYAGQRYAAFRNAVDAQQRKAETLKYMYARINGEIEPGMRREFKPSDYTVLEQREMLESRMAQVAERLNELNKKLEVPPNPGDGSGMETRKALEAERQSLIQESEVMLAESAELKTNSATGTEITPEEIQGISNQGDQEIGEAFNTFYAFPGMLFDPKMWRGIRDFFNSPIRRVSQDMGASVERTLDAGQHQPEVAKNQVDLLRMAAQQKAYSNNIMPINEVGYAAVQTGARAYSGLAYEGSLVAENFSARHDDVLKIMLGRDYLPMKKDLYEGKGLFGNLSAESFKYWDTLTGKRDLREMKAETTRNKIDRLLILAIESAYIVDPEARTFADTEAAKRVDPETGLMLNQIRDSLPAAARDFVLDAVMMFDAYGREATRRGWWADSDSLHEHTKKNGYFHTINIDKRTGDARGVRPFGMSDPTKDVSFTDAKKKASLLDRDQTVTPEVLDVGLSMSDYINQFAQRAAIDSLANHLTSNYDEMGRPLLMWGGQKYQLMGEVGEPFEPSTSLPGIVRLKQNVPLARFNKLSGKHETAYVHEDVAKVLESYYSKSFIQKGEGSDLGQAFKRAKTLSRSIILSNIGDNLTMLAASAYGVLGPVELAKNALGFGQTPGYWLSFNRTVSPEIRMKMAKSGYNAALQSDFIKGFYDEFDSRRYRTAEDRGMLKRMLLTLEQAGLDKWNVDKILYKSVDNVAVTMFTHLEKQYAAKGLPPESAAKMAAYTVNMSLNLPAKSTFDNTTSDMARYFLIARNLTFSQLRMMATAFDPAGKAMGKIPIVGKVLERNIGNRGMNKQELNAIQQTMQKYVFRQGLAFVFGSAVLSYMLSPKDEQGRGQWPWERARKQDWFKVSTGRVDANGREILWSNPLTKMFTDNAKFWSLPLAPLSGNGWSWVLSKADPTVKSVLEVATNTKFFPQGGKELVPKGAPSDEAAQIVIKEVLGYNGPLGRILEQKLEDPTHSLNPLTVFSDFLGFQESKGAPPGRIGVELEQQRLMDEADRFQQAKLAKKIYDLRMANRWDEANRLAIQYKMQTPKQMIEEELEFMDPERRLMEIMKPKTLRGQMAEQKLQAFRENE